MVNGGRVRHRPELRGGECADAGRCCAGSPEFPGRGRSWVGHHYIRSKKRLRVGRGVFLFRPHFDDPEVIDRHMLQFIEEGSPEKARIRVTIESLQAASRIERRNLFILDRLRRSFDFGHARILLIKLMARGPDLHLRGHDPGDDQRQQRAAAKHRPLDRVAPAEFFGRLLVRE